MILSQAFRTEVVDDVKLVGEDANEPEVLIRLRGGVRLEALMCV